MSAFNSFSVRMEINYVLNRSSEAYSGDMLGLKMNILRLKCSLFTPGSKEMCKKANQ